MSTFAINNSDPTAVVDAVNYLLANMGQGGSATGNNTSGNSLVANTTTGQITSGGTIISYLYPWMLVRYADSADGGTGFSKSPTNKAYYGLFNSVTPNPGASENPTDYQWTRVTGGFSTTKFLWYATYGGGQVAWSVGTAAPNSSYAQVINDTPVDLNFVTATSTLPLATPFIYKQANTLPATPTGGIYDFGNLILTPPTGWLTNLPTSSNTIPTYASQATFQAVPAGTPVGPKDGWTLPIALVQNGLNGNNGANGVNGSNGISTVNYNVFLSSNTAPSTPTGGYYNFALGQGTPPVGWQNNPISANGAPIYATTASLRSTDPNANVSIGSSWPAPFQYTGAGGAQGERGPIPMAYILTPSSPIGASTVQLSSWFGASRDNISAPIGMGTPPIPLDVACFTQQGNTDANIVYQFGNTNTWTSVQGSVVNGSLFVTGSVNANAMNVNDAYALTMRGGLVTPGIKSGRGFWLTGQSVNGAVAGDAYMSGNVYIGNTTTIGDNLIVGNNISIGSAANIGTNLTVGSGANIGTNLTVGSNANIGASLRVGSNAVIGDSLVVGNNASVGGNISIGNNAFIGGNVTIAGLSTGNASTGTTVLNVNTVKTTTIINGTISGGTAGTSSITPTTFATNPTQGVEYLTDMYVNISTTQPNQQVYIWSTLALTITFTGLSVGEQIEVQVDLIRQDDNTLAQTQISTKYYEVGGVTTVDVFPSFNGFVDVPPTAGPYTYGIGLTWYLIAGSAAVTAFKGADRNILTQTLKR